MARGESSAEPTANGNNAWVNSPAPAIGTELKRGLPSVLRELVAATAFVHANQSVFVDIDMGYRGKASACRTRLKFQLRSLQQFFN